MLMTQTSSMLRNELHISVDLKAVFNALLAGPTDNASLAHKVSAQQHPAAKRHYCQHERHPRETARAVRRDERREAPTGLAEG